MAEPVYNAAANAAVIDFDGDGVSKVVTHHKLLSKHDDVIGSTHSVLSLPLFVERHFLIDLVADDGFIITKTGHVTANMDCVRAPVWLVFGLYRAFHQGDRDEDIILLQWELSGDTDSENVAVLAVHTDNGVDKVLRHPAAIPAIDVECRIAGPVFVVAVIKKARQLRRVPTHEEPCSRS